MVDLNKTNMFNKNVISNLKKEYNKSNIILLIFSVLLELYIIIKTIDLFKK